MLSDEEKKAIERIEKLVEYLKKWNKNFTVVPKDVKYFEKILDMTKTHMRMIDENIEELLQQSKEIEEYKECERLSKRQLEKQKNVIKTLEIEIEELKEEYNTKLLSNAGIYQLGFNDGEKSVKNEIKAKIEEYEKEKNFYDKDEEREWGQFNNWDWTNNIINELQSLLEKE